MKLKLMFLIFNCLFIFNSPWVMSEVKLPRNLTTEVSARGQLRQYLDYNLDVFFSNASTGHDTSHPEYYRSNNWHCYSATDTSNGACPVTSESGGGDTYITIDFIEEKSKTKVQLQLRARAESYKCGLGYEWKMNSISYRTCSTDVAYGKNLYVQLIRSENIKIPFGGIWKAKLKIRQRNYGGPGPDYNAEWTSTITLDIYDRSSIAIYFPEFHSATPIVDLNLQANPSNSHPGRLVDGSKTLDMCLYDGRNAASSWYEITLSDGVSIGDRNKNQYSVLKDGSIDKNYRRRIDYRVTLKHNGKELELNNNGIVRLTKISDAERRLVTLPGMTEPVICTPTPLTLITSQFNQLDKEAGAYSGKLKVIFTPST